MLMWSEFAIQPTKVLWFAGLLPNSTHLPQGMLGLIGSETISSVFISTTDCSFNTVVKLVVQPGSTTGLTTGCIQHTAVCQTGC